MGLSLIRVLEACVLLSMLLAAECVASKNFTVFTPQVDQALQKAPDWLWDTAAGIGIALGTIFAFVGARMLRTAAFFFGAFGGALLAAVVLAGVGDVESQIWLPVVATTAVICGLLVSCVLRLARFVTIIVLGVTMSGVIIQYGFSYIQGLPNWVLYVMIGVAVLLCAFVAWKFYSFMMIFATSFVGGFVVLVSTARLTRGPISLAGMWVDTAFLRACVDITCWGPFIAGGGVCVLGLLYQLRRMTGIGKGKKIDKRTKRELEASERARKQEHVRFEQRVNEIRRVADEEIAQATAATRRVQDDAEEERKALLLQSRQLEEERERLRQERSRLEQESRIVEAEFVHYSDAVADLPVASPTAGARGTVPKRQLMKRPTRPATRPPPPTPDGWGGGAKPWNKCPTHQVTYEVCGCTNPRSKDQVMAELERLKQEKEKSEQDQKHLEQRNNELKERLRRAEQAAIAAATQASLAQQKAAEELIKSAEFELKLESERLELERLLLGAEAEKIAASEQLKALREARRQEQQLQQAQQNPRGGVTPGDEAAAGAAATMMTDSSVLITPTGDKAAEAEAALEEEELKLKERKAQAEGLEETIRREIELLEKTPVRVLTELNLAAKLEEEALAQAAAAANPQPPSSPSLVRRMSLQVLPPRPLREAGNTNTSVTAPPTASPQTQFPKNRFASKWSHVEKTYSADGGSAARTATVVEMSTTNSTGARTQTGDADHNNPTAAQSELEPVQDLFSDVMKLLGDVFQFILEAIVFVIAVIAKALGKVADAVRDAQMERQESQIRSTSQRKSQFRASDVKQRFSSPAKVENTV